MFKLASLLLLLGVAASPAGCGDEPPNGEVDPRPLIEFTRAAESATGNERLTLDVQGNVAVFSPSTGHVDRFAIPAEEVAGLRSIIEAARLEEVENMRGRACERCVDYTLTTTVGRTILRRVDPIAGELDEPLARLIGTLGALMARGHDHGP